MAQSTQPPAPQIGSPEVNARPALLARLRSELNLGDTTFRYVTAGFAALVLIAMAAVGYEMLTASEHSIKEFGWGFIASSEWNPVSSEFGALPFIWGTLVSSLLALVISVPISF